MGRRSLLCALLAPCALGAPPSALAAPPAVGCAEHVEPTAAFDAARDIVRGPFALVTVRRDLPRLARASYRPRGGRLAQVKLPVGLRASHRATLRVSAAQRARIGLLHRPAVARATRVRDADSAVTFQACAADAPAFTGGVVGPTTGWAGALVVDGPRCARLELVVDGRRLRDIRLPLGRRCA